MTVRFHHLPARLRAPVIVGFLAAAVASGWIYRARAATEPREVEVSSAPKILPSGALELPQAQWASLDIRTVASASFATVAVADAVVTVDENVTVPVFSPATGRLQEVHAEIGQVVRKGQLLATIAGSETSQAASDLAAATALARTAAQQLSQARATAARQRGLLDAGGGTNKDLLQSQSDLTAAEGAKSSADAALAAARVKATAVGLDDASQAGRLTSPLDGQVIQRQATPGQFIGSLASGGSTPLFTISDLRRLWVLGSVAEREAATVRVGQGVEVSVPGIPKPIRARVAWVSPTVDAPSRRVQFRVEIGNLGLALKPQMTARLRVLDPQAAPSIAIPGSAVIHDGRQAHCYVLVGARQLAMRELTLGRSDGGEVEVLSGLKAGERIVARGAIFVDAMAEGAAS
jgi:cobalt-zinc-cadmium efflux system membrane fusion protein